MYLCIYYASISTKILVYNASLGLYSLHKKNSQSEAAPLSMSYCMEKTVSQTILGHFSYLIRNDLKQPKLSWTNSMSEGNDIIISL